MSKKGHKLQQKQQATALNQEPLQQKRPQTSTQRFVDQSPRVQKAAQLKAVANNSPQVQKAIQLKAIMNKKGQNTNEVAQLKTVTVHNNHNSYESAWLDSMTRTNGVDPGPRQEAQDVQGIAGGSWVGGHMINDSLGGTGGYENIVPITSTMNNAHHTIENAAQNKVGNGGTEYEVKYYMDILNRENYSFNNNQDHVKNLPNRFQQKYDYRTKAVEGGGSRSRPRPARDAGPVTTVTGEVLDMDVPGH